MNEVGAFFSFLFCSARTIFILISPFSSLRSLRCVRRSQVHFLPPSFTSCNIIKGGKGANLVYLLRAPLTHYFPRLFIRLTHSLKKAKREK